MMVTYRLAGVDGEATEEVVDSLVDSDSAADQDPEVKFGIARDIAEVGSVFFFRKRVYLIFIFFQIFVSLSFLRN